MHVVTNFNRMTISFVNKLDFLPSSPVASLNFHGDLLELVLAVFEVIFDLFFCEAEWPVIKYHRVFCVECQIEIQDVKSCCVWSE